MNNINVLMYVCVALCLLSLKSIAMLPLESSHVETNLLNTKMVEKSVYICPMHSHIKGESGDKCPICGMNLEKVIIKEDYKEDNKEIKINVNGNTQQLMGIRTSIIELSDFERSVNSVGVVGYDSDLVQDIYSRAEGWIEEANIKSVGDIVKKGDLIYTIYSKEMVVAQQDYILSVNAALSNNMMIKSSTKRLELLGVSNLEIINLRKHKKVKYSMPVYAKSDGIVTYINFKKGTHITKTDKMATITDMSNLWITTLLSEKDQNGVKINQVVLLYLDGKAINSEVDYIYPELDKKTNQLKLRMSVRNSGLRPNMLLNLQLKLDKKRDVIMIPREALIQIETKNTVILRNEDKTFSSREVLIGGYDDHNVEVVSGLNVGEEVVISGQFLLDSESSLQGGFLRLDGVHNEH